MEDRHIPSSIKFLERALYILLGISAIAGIFVVLMDSYIPLFYSLASLIIAPSLFKRRVKLIRGHIVIKNGSTAIPVEKINAVYRYKSSLKFLNPAYSGPWATHWFIDVGGEDEHDVFVDDLSFIAKEIAKTIGVPIERRKFD